MYGHLGSALYETEQAFYLCDVQKRLVRVRLLRLMTCVARWSFSRRPNRMTDGSSGDGVWLVCFIEVGLDFTAEFTVYFLFSSCFIRSILFHVAEPRHMVSTRIFAHAFFYTPFQTLQQLVTFAIDFFSL